MNPDQLKSIEDQLNASPLAQALRERDQARAELSTVRGLIQRAREVLEDETQTPALIAMPTGARAVIDSLAIRLARAHAVLIEALGAELPTEVVLNAVCLKCRALYRATVLRNGICPRCSSIRKGE